MRAGLWSLNGEWEGTLVLLTYVWMIQNLHYSYFSEQLEEKTHGFISCLPTDFRPLQSPSEVFLSLFSFKTDPLLKKTKLKALEEEEGREGSGTELAHSLTHCSDLALFHTHPNLASTQQSDASLCGEGEPELSCQH